MESHLFVIDNSPAIRRLVEQAATGEGFKVLAFSDGPAALAEAERVKPSIILADYHLEGVTFTTFCDKLGTLEVLPPAQLVLLKNASDRCDENAMRAKGVEAFLNKPLHQEQVTGLIQELRDAKPKKEEPDKTVRLKRRAWPPDNQAIGSEDGAETGEPDLPTEEPSESTPPVSATDEIAGDEPKPISAAIAAAAAVLGRKHIQPEKDLLEAGKSPFKFKDVTGKRPSPKQSASKTQGPQKAQGDTEQETAAPAQSPAQGAKASAEKASPEKFSLDKLSAKKPAAEKPSEQEAAPGKPAPEKFSLDKLSVGTPSLQQDPSEEPSSQAEPELEHVSTEAAEPATLEPGPLPSANLIDAGDEPPKKAKPQGKGKFLVPPAAETPESSLPPVAEIESRPVSSDPAPANGLPHSLEEAMRSFLLQLVETLSAGSNGQHRQGGGHPSGSMNGEGLQGISDQGGPTTEDTTIKVVRELIVPVVQQHLPDTVRDHLGPTEMLIKEAVHEAAARHVRQVAESIVREIAEQQIAQQVAAAVADIAESHIKQEIQRLTTSE